MNDFKQLERGKRFGKEICKLIREVSLVYAASLRGAIATSKLGVMISTGNDRNILIRYSIY